MATIILNQNDELIHPAGVALLYHLRDGSTRLIRTSPSESFAFARKVASNRSHLSGNYEAYHVIILPFHVAQRIFAVLENAAAAGNEEARRLLSDVVGDCGGAVSGRTQVEREEQKENDDKVEKDGGA
jgi:hypothetical protein